MIRLTKDEKAARYDALQAAIRFTLEAYRTRRTECLRNYEAYGADTGVIAAYNKGMGDAFGIFLEALERWSDT
jgi:hypothetical protein